MSLLNRAAKQLMLPNFFGGQDNTMPGNVGSDAASVATEDGLKSAMENRHLLRAVQKGEETNSYHASEMGRNYLEF